MFAIWAGLGRTWEVTWKFSDMSNSAREETWYVSPNLTIEILGRNISQMLEQLEPHLEVALNWLLWAEHHLIQQSGDVLAPQPTHYVP